MVNCIPDEPQVVLHRSSISEQGLARIYFHCLALRRRLRLRRWLWRLGLRRCRLRSFDLDVHHLDFSLFVSLLVEFWRRGRDRLGRRIGRGGGWWPVVKAEERCRHFRAAVFIVTAVLPTIVPR